MPAQKARRRRERVCARNDEHMSEMHEGRGRHAVSKRKVGEVGGKVGEVEVSRRREGV